MNSIHKLDQTTIDKIAAGEVVERPSSVVKELTENAVDAGADRITIEIRDGGISLIRVSDNGRGISAGDISLAFLRHATSKIRTAEDLSSIGSLGFRGEALSSIAAVSRVEMITKRKDELAATRLLIEGGREKSREEVGAPDGTTIVVRDLFYNTPARAKFLKTPLTEASHVGDYTEQLILSNPGISFTWIVNGQTRLASSGSGRLIDAICAVYGRETAGLLIPLSADEGGIRLEGYIGKPALTRGNRNFENYYVNGRYVKSRVIQKGIEDGYGTSLMQHQYPFTCFCLTVAGEAVDVNVHPTKMEVRFSDEKKIYDAVREAVHGTLSRIDQIVASSMNKPEKKEKQTEKKKDAVMPFQAFESGAPGTGSEAVKQKTAEEESGVPSSGGRREKESALPPSGMGREEESALPPSGAGREERNVPPASAVYEEAGEKLRGQLMSETPAGYAGAVIRNEEEGSRREGAFVQQTFAPRFLSEEARPLRRIVGQVFSTYWICEFGEKVYLFDQHAAHERVLYEKFMTAYENREITSQQLMPPMLVSLSAREQALLEAYGEAFEELGFEIEHFGGRDFAVRAVPYYLGTINSDQLFREFLDQLEVTSSLGDMRTYILKVATEACKAAVKGGERISAAEAGKLLDDLMKCSDPYHCPHGRPTVISFTEKDLEKRFKRIV